MESKTMLNLKDLTDDKNAWKQGDLKLVNALVYIQPGYGAALDRLKECVDMGQDPEDIRPGAASGIGAAHFGTALIENLRSMNLEHTGPIDVERLDADLEFILIERRSRASSNDSPTSRNTEV